MFFKILLFLLSIKTILSLNSNDFCYSTEVMCLNNRECTKECNDLFRKYKCSRNLCTVNKTKCDEYINEKWFDILSLSYSNRISRFQSRIKNCTKVTFKLDPKDVCTNINKICFEESFFFDSFSTNVSKIKKRQDCKCNGKYSYKCEDNFCAVKKRACDAFITLKSKLINKILKC